MNLHILDRGGGWVGWGWGDERELQIPVPALLEQVEKGFGPRHLKSEINSILSNLSPYFPPLCLYTLVPNF